MRPSGSIASTSTTTPRSTPRRRPTCCESTRSICDEYYVFNVLGFLITTNHKTDGIYLPADDRRHYVAWSNFTKEDFQAGLLERRSGAGTTPAASSTSPPISSELDISGFDPKAPPPQTPAWWDIVSTNRAPEDAELADVIDAIGNPDAMTVKQLIARRRVRSQNGYQNAEAAARFRIDSSAVATSR